MSQIIRSIPGAMPPAGFVATLTGNTGGAVSPDGAQNINVVSDNTSFTTSLEPSGYLFHGNIQTNTLTYRAVPYTAQTVGAVSTTIFTLPLAVNSAATVSAEIVALRDDAGACGSGFVIGGGRRAAGAAIALTTVDQNFIDDDTGGELSITFTAGGNDLIIGVTGIAATTYNWTAFVRYTLQT